MKKHYLLYLLLPLLYSPYAAGQQAADSIHPDAQYAKAILINKRAKGFRGIWYYNQKIDNEYVYKYSGGMATYCAKHQPFAVYAPEVDKTFFCYGGTGERDTTLLHMVSYFDHKTGKVARPTILLDKQTTDAHDNPVITLDEDGYIWIFSTSHGISRPSYVHKSKKPYNIRSFEPVNAMRQEDGQAVPINNFSYMQSWYVPGQGFINFFTRYKDPADRTTYFMRSEDGKDWTAWQRLTAIQKGHYQISAVTEQKAGAAFNFHPDTPEKNGLNWRTNLYYIETPDFGNTWQAADGTPLTLPLTEQQNPALIHDYFQEDLNVYLKDIQYDAAGRPIILYLTSKGYEAGPQNDPRTWHTARWDGKQWDIHDITTSDNNYDMGSLYLEEDGVWRLIAPTETGPQPYNPGGEMAMWTSRDQGKSWQKTKQLTTGSKRNHTYARRPAKAQSGFYALWADGHGRQPSESVLYFSNQAGEVFMLPQRMRRKRQKPMALSNIEMR